MLDKFKFIQSFAVLLISFTFLAIEHSDAIQLRTTSPRLVTAASNNDNGLALQDFISRPIHWPDIVLSSNRVEVFKDEAEEQTQDQQQQQQQSPFRWFEKDKSKPCRAATSPAFDTLQEGDIVEEYFALGQLKVEWTCIRNEPGRLILVSPEGVKGIAANCVMDFEFDDSDEETASAVRLTMKYAPQSLLAVLATPVLVIDNWLALNVLLPAAVDNTPLDSFRKIMGIFYAGAGIAHFLDLTIGGSHLFTDVLGIASFENLPIVGQLYALLWCAMGPVSYCLSASSLGNDDDDDDDDERESETTAPTVADLGLVLYGTVEIVGTILSSGMDGASNGIYNALGIQGVVLAAWFYSYKKQERIMKKESISTV